MAIECTQDYVAIEVLSNVSSALIPPIIAIAVAVAVTIARCE